MPGVTRITLRVVWVVATIVACVAGTASADDVWYRYEGEVLPYDESAGWVVYNACDGVCHEFIEDGHYRTEYVANGDGRYNFDYTVARPGDILPDSFWVEWRQRASQPHPPFSHICNARFTVAHDTIYATVYFFSDAVFTDSGADGVTGLDPEAFHTYRYESPDGMTYWFSVDGFVFVQSAGFKGPFGVFLQFAGTGACSPDNVPIINEWDMVRFGTISYGEQVVATDPPAGFVDPRMHPALDRFAVTFDAANYVYVDEITVEVTGGSEPIVTQTRRRDGDEPDTLEIVLDRPIPYGQTTRFTLFDGVATNTVEYTYAPGDANGDGAVDLFDMAGFQNCFGADPIAGACVLLDLNGNDAVDLADFAVFHGLLTD